MEKRYTYADYLQWPDDTRCELIDGEAFLMSPAPLVEHQEVAGEVVSPASPTSSTASPAAPYIAPVDVRLPRKDEADAAIDTVVQPDVLVVCDPRKIDCRGVRGAPDWVLEVLSPAPPPTTRRQAPHLRARRGSRVLAGASWRPHAYGLSCSKTASTVARRSRTGRTKPPSACCRACRSPGTRSSTRPPKPEY